MHCVDLGESFHLSHYLQHLGSIQPRSSLVKFARSPRTDPSGVLAVATFRYNTAKNERSTVASLVIEYNSFTALC